MSVCSRWLSVFLGWISLIFAPLAGATDALQLNLIRGVTPVAHAQYDLHMAMLLVATAIGVLVFAVLIYSLIRHRKSRGVKPAEFHENIQIEVIWTVIPFIILIVLAIPATRAYLLLEDTERSDMTIAVTGYQWYWKYDYLGEGLSFLSNLSTSQEAIDNLLPKTENYLLEVDNPVVIPTHTKVRFTFTANDVLHSWFVPDLGIKKDTVPGFVNQAWAYVEKPGIYRGQCAELCGIRHGFMPIVVEAKSPEDYEAWLQSKKNPDKEG